MKISPHLRLGGEALSHQAKAGVMPIEKPQPRAKKPGGLSRSTPLKRPQPQSRNTPDGWRSEIRGQLCAACEQRPAREGHHIIPVQVLRREASRLGYQLQDAIWDRRNRLALCTGCHERHHNRSRRLSHDLLFAAARAVYAFAEDLGLETALEREYAARLYPGRQPIQQEAP